MQLDQKHIIIFLFYVPPNSKAKVAPLPIIITLQCKKLHSKFNMLQVRKIFLSEKKREFPLRSRKQNFNLGTVKLLNS